jgi:hypothetical protein
MHATSASWPQVFTKAVRTGSDRACGALCTGLKKASIGDGDDRKIRNTATGGGRSDAAVFLHPRTGVPLAMLAWHRAQHHSLRKDATLRHLGMLADTIETVERHYAPFTKELRERVRGPIDNGEGLEKTDCTKSNRLTAACNDSKIFSGG